MTPSAGRQSIQSRRAPCTLLGRLDRNCSLRNPLSFSQKELTFDQSLSSHLTIRYISWHEILLIAIGLEQHYPGIVIAPEKGFLESKPHPVFDSVMAPANVDLTSACPYRRMYRLLSSCRMDGWALEQKEERSGCRGKQEACLLQPVKEWMWVYGAVWEERWPSRGAVIQAKASCCQAYGPYALFKQHACVHTSFMCHHHSQTCITSLLVCVVICPVAAIQEASVEVRCDREGVLSVHVYVEESIERVHSIASISAWHVGGYWRCY